MNRTTRDQTVATYDEEKLREGNTNGGLDFGVKRETVSNGFILLKVVYISRMVYMKMILKAEKCSSSS